MSLLGSYVCVDRWAHGILKYYELPPDQERMWPTTPCPDCGRTARLDAKGCVFQHAPPICDELRRRREPPPPPHPEEVADLDFYATLRVARLR